MPPPTGSSGKGSDHPAWASGVSLGPRPSDGPGAWASPTGVRAGPRRGFSSLQMVNSTQETSPAGGSGDPKLADPSAIWPVDTGTCCQSQESCGNS